MKRNWNNELYINTKIKNIYIFNNILYSLMNFFQFSKDYNLKLFMNFANKLNIIQGINFSL